MVNPSKAGTQEERKITWTEGGDPFTAQGPSPVASFMEVLATKQVHLGMVTTYGCKGWGELLSLKMTANAP
jgi:hypothetical protein